MEIDKNREYKYTCYINFILSLLSGDPFNEDINE